MKLRIQTVINIIVVIAVLAMFIYLLPEFIKIIDGVFNHTISNQ